MARKPQENPALDMTPMIDVVFELIIFFVVTIQQEDIYSRLNANRPAPSSGSASNESETTVEIQIGAVDPNRRPTDKTAQGVILYNKAVVTREKLRQNLKEIALSSTKTPIIVKCAKNSPHKALIDVLDICYAEKLYSVSIFDLDNIGK